MSFSVAMSVAQFAQYDRKCFHRDGVNGRIQFFNRTIQNFSSLLFPQNFAVSGLQRVITRNEEFFLKTRVEAYAIYIDRFSSFRLHSIAKVVFSLVQFSIGLR